MSVQEINVAEFAGFIDRFAQKSQKQAVAAQRALTLEIEGDVKAQWPVDTGRSRAAWHSSAGVPSNWTPTATETQDSTGALAGLKLGQPTYIQNNVPYAQALNDGHSKQMPAGAVEAAIAGAVGRA